MFSFISLFLPYIWHDSATTAGPRRNRRTSPAPQSMGESVPALKAESTPRNVDPVSRAKTLDTSHVRLVQVTSGCTSFVKDFGKFAPKTKVDSVVPSRKSDRAGLIHSDPGLHLTSAIVDRLAAEATANRLFSSVCVNGLVAAVAPALGAGAAAASSASSPPPASFRIPSTDHDVVSRVKKNPPTMTDMSFRTSAALPSPPARGSVIRLGTKKTGSHLASRAAPGFRAPWTASPQLFPAPSRSIIDAKRVPHPASDDGKGIAYRARRDRNCVSRSIRADVASIVLVLVPAGAAVEEDDALDARATPVRLRRAEAKPRLGPADPDPVDKRPDGSMLTPRGGTRPCCDDISDDALFLLLGDTLDGHRTGDAWRFDTSADDGRAAWAARRIGMSHAAILMFHARSVFVSLSLVWAPRSGRVPLASLVQSDV
mmetsp:Transcript_29261/g.66085  ORF Transcript_29261/g.66085 Transcript_29261/m.66085 type:complete len:428 (-) Transcript_29261:204-1487(-)